MKSILFCFFGMFFAMCNTKSETKISKATMTINNKEEIAIFAGGCFWCTEAVFLELKGVKSVKPGYIGGKNPNPTYEEVCSGYSGHAEGIEIIFDPNIISFGELLEIFFATHDPTTINRQGNDVGSQYRSEVFYNNENQQKTAIDYINLLNTESTFGKKVVTKVSKSTPFYIAEDYHQNYYNQNKEKSYCQYVITQKIEKLQKQFKNKLKN